MDKHTRTGALARLRNYFLTGFVVVAPLTITVYLIWSFITWVDGWVVPYLPAVYNPRNYLPFGVPGIGLIVAGVVITLVGFLTANFIGRSIVNLGERMLNRTPLVRNIYNGLKQIFQTIFSGQTGSFSKAGLLEYPRKGLWAIVFIATETKGEVQDRLSREAQQSISVFLPTTPNPTSGFLLFVPKKDVIVLDMTVEEAAKLVISAGLVTPEYNGKSGGQPVVIPGTKSDVAQKVLEMAGDGEARPAARRSRKPKSES